MRVLLSNDDGPPGTDSPFIVGLVGEMVKKGWNVSVVIPSSQKSWISKAFQIRDQVHASFIYPTLDNKIGPYDALHQPRGVRDGELGEWILLDGTPATCVNIGIHHFSKEPFDLVVSGPNYGRNTSNAFSLSSGTIGGAMEGSLCGIKSIAISYAIVDKPIPQHSIYVSQTAVADRIAVQLIEKLYASWPKDSADLYSINIPLVHQLSDQSKIQWTNLYRGRYGRLFKATQPDHPSISKITTTPQDESTREGSMTFRVTLTVVDREARAVGPGGVLPNGEGPSKPVDVSDDRLTFVFAPDIKMLIDPRSDLPDDCDAWAIQNGIISVTALKTGFEQVPIHIAKNITELGKL
ncbi:hypothetical protein PROFUN_00868 [Planoprotostelium fungivorum]|uniref:Survival protein SurE-like phosphatase/nucleotidase domain-containing protein n=1 Tax=Planoprotostelium fungivorum TaxID=1890364 RepID=A0A2P6P085_9EUKA|nr:hypothetical protein PROFUN_00868 [Planoprotostelium fungivorum]